MLAVLCVTLTGCFGPADPEPQPQPTAPPPESTLPEGALIAGPDGGGEKCTFDSACTIDEALSQAKPGMHIGLLGGEYGDVKPRADGGAEGSPVVIQPVTADAEPVLTRLDTYVPFAVWKDLTVTTLLYVRPAGHDTRIENVHITAGGAFLKSTNVTVVNSLFEGGSSLDGIQIGGAENILIEDTTVRDYNQSGDTEYHADCLQIFDSTGITVRRNYLGNCYNASIIFSGGGGHGISDVLIESNFVQGCLVKNDECAYGTLIDLREPSSTDVVVRNNTMLGGSVRVAPLPGLVFDRNILDYLSQCDTAMTNSIVHRWNEGLCDEPDAIGRDGNRVGEVAVADLSAGDLHLADKESARIEPSSGLEPAPEDFDGEPMDPTIAGADS